MIVIFFNLYKLDISQDPLDSDLLLCLGGGTGERLEKTIFLYKNNFIKEKIIISDTYEKDVLYKTEKLKANIDKNIPIISKFFTRNTLEELLFSQDILEKYNYKSILIVSDEPHTKRIQILIENFTKFKQLNIKYTIVGSEVKWWNKKKFYENKKAIYFSIHEFFKIIHNYILYSLKSYSIINEENINEINLYKNDFLKQVNIIIKEFLNYQKDI